MKGIVFTTINKLVVNKFGNKAWENILTNLNPTSGGAYTSIGTYDDTEFTGIVNELSKQTKVTKHDIVFEFGKFFMESLKQSYPHFFQLEDYREFLKSVDEIIHVEIRKLYPEARTPFLSYEDFGEKVIIMYSSERKLCSLAEGLIHGSANVYKANVSINHKECMHDGSDHCKLELIIE